MKQMKQSKGLVERAGQKETIEEEGRFWKKNTVERLFLSTRYSTVYKSIVISSALEPYLKSYFNEGLSMVGEEQMIVRNSVTNRIVRTNYVDEGREKRQSVTIVGGCEISDPFVRLRMSIRDCGGKSKHRR